MPSQPPSRRSGAPAMVSFDFFPSLWKLNSSLKWTASVEHVDREHSYGVKSASIVVFQKTGRPPRGKPRKSVNLFSSPETPRR